MYDEAVRLGEPRPHLTELAVASHRDLVASGEEIANRCLERASSGRVNGQWFARRPEHGSEQLDGRRQLARELWCAMVDHGACAGSEHALGDARWPGRHE